MPLDAKELAEFIQLVGENSRSTERDCQQKLHHAQDMLFQVTVIAFEPIRMEQRSYYGDTDFCVCAEVRSDAGGKERQLSLWELKSPQSIIMEADDNANRWRPTKALIKAETQLLHYYYQAKLDGDLHRRFNVFPENIMPGGIIMGRDDTWCSDQSRLRDARRSHMIRSTYFYKHSGFRFFTWSRVIEHLTPSKPQ